MTALFSVSITRLATHRTHTPLFVSFPGSRLLNEAEEGGRDHVIATINDIPRSRSTDTG